MDNADSQIILNYFGHNISQLPNSGTCHEQPITQIPRIATAFQVLSDYTGAVILDNYGFTHRIGYGKLYKDQNGKTDPEFNSSKAADLEYSLTTGYVITMFMQ